MSGLQAEAADQHPTVPPLDWLIAKVREIKGGAELLLLMDSIFMKPFKGGGRGIRDPIYPATHSSTRAEREREKKKSCAGKVYFFLITVYISRWYLVFNALLSGHSVKNEGRGGQVRRFETTTELTWRLLRAGGWSRGRCDWNLWYQNEHNVETKRKVSQPENQCIYFVILVLNALGQGWENCWWGHNGF